MATNHPLFERPLPREWSLLTVDDIKSPERSSCVAGPFGSNISSKYFVDVGVPVIRGNNLSDKLTKFVPEGFAFVAPERARAYAAQHVRGGDLVFTCWGTIGQVGLIPHDGPFPEYIISNKQLKLRPNKELCDDQYLYYYFASREMVNHIRGRAIGAAVPGINLGILKALPVVLPPLYTQRRIADILSAYDDLIENNTKRIKILEEMARSLYREWFVNFRFPGHGRMRLVASPLGDIPAGWSVAALESVAAYINRGVAPKYAEDGPELVISQKCVRDQRLSLEPARRHGTRVPPDKYVKRGDVLVNSTGIGTLGRVAQVLEELSGCTVDTHVTIARPSRSVDDHYFGLTLLAKESYFESQGAGATGQTELARGRVAATELLLPPLVLQKKFGELVDPMRAAGISLAKRNTVLRRTRDLLLPRLLSGEIDVSRLPVPAGGER